MHIKTLKLRVRIPSNENYRYDKLPVDAGSTIKDRPENVFGCPRIGERVSHSRAREGYRFESCVRNNVRMAEKADAMLSKPTHL